MACSHVERRKAAGTTSATRGSLDEKTDGILKTSVEIQNLEELVRVGGGVGLPTANRVWRYWYGIARPGPSPVGTTCLNKSGLREL